MKHELTQQQLGFLYSLHIDYRRSLFPTNAIDGVLGLYCLWDRTDNKKKEIKQKAQLFELFAKEAEPPWRYRRTEDRRNCVY